jgi:hypothetical protein
MTVLLLRRPHSSFIDHSCLQCIVCIALSEVWESIFLNLSHISPPPNMVWTFLPQFRKLFRTLVNEKTLITYFIHMITSCKIKLFLSLYESTFILFHFNNSTESSYYQYFCKSCLHVILIMRFVCNFLLFLNSY